MSIFVGRASASRLLKIIVSLDTAVKGGIPIVRALSLAAAGCRDRRMREVLEVVVDGLRHGDTLGGAVKPYQGYLGDELTAGLSVGDASGKLDEALGVLVEIFEYRVRMHRAVARQLAYPVCIIFIAVVVLPYVRGFMSATESVSDYTLGYIFGLRYMAAYLMLCWIGIVFVLGVRPLRRGFGFVFSSLWPFGGTLRRFALARFLDSLGLLLTAGLSNVRAVELSIHFAANLRVERALARMVEPIRNGSPVYEALGLTGIAPRGVLDYIEIAETSGNVERALHGSAVELTSGSRHGVEIVVSLLGSLAILFIGFLIVTRIIKF